MPVYEYACMECEGHFEELVRMGDEAPTCPDCGGGDVVRQLSAFAVHAGGGSPGTSESPPAPRPGGCCGGGCCGGG